MVSFLTKVNGTTIYLNLGFKIQSVTSFGSPNKVIAFSDSLALFLIPCVPFSLTISGRRNC